MLTKNVRQIIRKEGWVNLKRKYYLNILITFIVSVIISGGYQFATRTSGTLNDNAISTTAELVEAESGNGLLGKDSNRSNAETLRQFIFNIFEIQDISDPDDIPTTSEKYYGGVASVFVNEISGSQSFIFGILNGVNQLAFGGKIASSIIIFIFAIISIFIFIFFKNVIVVGKNRYFLEQRRYHGTGAGELLFPYKNKRLKNIALVMFVRYIFQVLWNLTIVGGIIKRYEYYLIPYVVAENPSITRKEAFELSKTLMMGEKWKCFVLEMSLFPWYILSYLTFNLSGLFFSDAYIECVKAEIYMQIRNAKKDELRLGLRKLLNDDLLAIDHIEETEHPSGVEVMDIPQVSVHDLKYDYNRSYPFISLVQLFFTYSLVGWVWEVFYYIATTGMVVNRGTMHGPWLPIYGVGGILIILLLKPLREKPGLLFAGAVVVCGVVEYATAWALETFLHKKWWDYTGFFLNIHGRVCFEGLLVFGMAGLAFTYIFSPMLDDFYKDKLDIKYRRIICIILIVLFVADLVWSVISPNTGVGVTM
ncbi:Protein of unknown function [Lachnospiraceae bacterium NE2001]|nr:Protein of unknown function [Lachnospiraceae bacterium NE2001]